MQYECYIDVFFLVNFVMDVPLLWMVGKLLKIPVSRRRLALGGVVGAAGSCLAVIFWYLPVGLIWLIGGIFPACAMVAAVFRPKGFRSFVKMLMLLLMVAFCVGGMVEAMYEHTKAGYYLAWILQGRVGEGMPILIGGFLAAGAWFGCRFLWLNALEVRRERRTMYVVTLTAADISAAECVSASENAAGAAVTGYLDTGNCLREPEHGCPVHIVSEKLWKSLWRPGTKTMQIPFHTIGNPLGVMEGMQIRRMEVQGEKGETWELSEPWVARAPFRLTKEGGYDVLLHKDTFREKIADRRSGSI